MSSMTVSFLILAVLFSLIGARLPARDGDDRVPQALRYAYHGFLVGSGALCLLGAAWGVATLLCGARAAEITGGLMDSVIVFIAACATAVPGSIVSDALIQAASRLLRACKMPSVRCL